MRRVLWASGLLGEHLGLLWIRGMALISVSDMSVERMLTWARQIWVLLVVRLTLVWAGGCFLG